MYSGGDARADAGPIELLPMRQPEFGALADAPVVQENRAILVPRLGLLGGPFHGLEDGRLALGSLQELAQLPLLEIVLLRHLRDEVLHVGAMDVERDRAGARREQGRGQKQDIRDRRRTHAVRTR